MVEFKKLSKMEVKSQEQAKRLSRGSLISGFCLLTLGVMLPFREGLSDFEIAISAFLSIYGGGYSIYYSQHIKYNYTIKKE